MKAAVIALGAAGKVLETREVDLPLIGPTDVLVRVGKVGICGSDLHGFSDPSDDSRQPGLIMGHEFGGEIADVGSLVPHLSVGTSVTVDPQIRCGRCVAGENGWFSICAHKQVLGSSRRGFVHGGFAQYACVAAEQVLPVPDVVSPAQAALIEPLSNGLHVVQRAEPAAGDLVVVLGAGTLGLSIVQAFAAAGDFRIVSTDISDAKLELATALGAVATVNAGRHDVAEVVADLSGGLGADIVVEAVGVGAVYRQAIAIARRRGKVMFFGAAAPTIELDPIPILHKELLLIGCTGANDESADAVHLVADGTVDLMPLVTHEFSLDDAQEAMETLADPASGAVKVLLCP
jgi:threonine dehydrogenase-like Zn-dependent dehydrogenase